MDSKLTSSLVGPPSNFCKFYLYIRSNWASASIQVLNYTMSSKVGHLVFDKDIKDRRRALYA